MTYSYVIEKGNLVKIWFGDPEVAAPLVQPTWPDGTKWASKADAEAWALAYIAAQEDPNVDRPGNGPDQKFIPFGDLMTSDEEWSEREAEWAAQRIEREAWDAAAAAAFEENRHPVGAPLLDQADGDPSAEDSRVQDI